MTALLLLPVALSFLASLVLALDWWDSGIAPWVAEGLAASLVAVWPLALALLALAPAPLRSTTSHPACPCGPGVDGIVGVVGCARW